MNVVCTCDVFSSNRAVAKGVIHAGGMLGISWICTIVVIELLWFSTSKIYVLKLYMARLSNLSSTATLFRIVKLNIIPLYETRLN